MFNRKKTLRKILKEAEKKKERSLSTSDDLLFLDYDGVINIDIGNFGRKPFDPHCMENLNRLCREFDLKIVVCSSWKKYPDYQKKLYESGLDPAITILGKTEILNGPREDEIKQYLMDHPYFDRFIILDDGRFDELAPYQIRTDFFEGFNDNKLEEAKKLLKDFPYLNSR